MGNKDLAKFFPEQKTAADLPDREYFFNILNTVEPTYLQKLIQHAQQQRFSKLIPNENPNLIEINDFWKKELQSSSYFSRKFIAFSIIKVHLERP